MILNSEEQKNEMVFRHIKQFLDIQYEKQSCNEVQSKMFISCDNRLFPDKKVMKLHFQCTFRPTVELIEFYRKQYRKEWENRNVEREAFVQRCLSALEINVNNVFSYATKIKGDVTFREKEEVVKCIEIHFYIEIDLMDQERFVLTKQIGNSLEELKERFLKNLEKYIDDREGGE